ncbi:MAG: hypothetical protein LUC91_02770, partial [Prevotella sp.]|nr:hypothetical protein [Prevotella sp.]
MASVLTAFAQYTGDGYYRVQNVKTERYIVVIDDKGSINFSTTDADLGALRSYEGYDAVVSNPGSIIYAEKNGTANEYRLYSQGTDTYSIVGVYLKLHENGDGTYKAYATKSGMTKYLADEDDVYNPGYLNTWGTSSKTDYISNWNILPVDASDENSYFGLTPEYTVDDGYYLSFYASFPFSFASDGMTAYYIDKVGTAEDGYGLAVWKEITDEMKPAATPMIVKCSSTEPTNNKLNLLSSSSVSISESLLSGVYFCNTERTTHHNVVDYNPSTMRVLGITSTGSIGFVTASVDDLPYIPANTAYLNVPEGTASELHLVTDEEYDQLMEEHKVIDDGNVGDGNDDGNIGDGN